MDADSPAAVAAGAQEDPAPRAQIDGRPAEGSDEQSADDGAFELEVDNVFQEDALAETQSLDDGPAEPDAAARRSHWDVLPPQLRDDLRHSGNLLWVQCAKALARAAKPAPLYKPVHSFARTANLGSLVNTPRPNAEVNKRICIVRGDLLAVRCEAYILPTATSLAAADCSEVTALVYARAGPLLAPELKRAGASLRPGECCLTRAYDTGVGVHTQLHGGAADGASAGGFSSPVGTYTGRGGASAGAAGAGAGAGHADAYGPAVYPMFLLHTIPPRTEDPAVLKSCYERSLYIALSEELRTIACPVLAGQPYPEPGQPYYPLVGAVHVFLSVLRTWLDRRDVRDRVDLFVIVCGTERESATLQELMPLYFPHDAANEESDSVNDPPAAAAGPEDAGAGTKAKKAKKGKKGAKGKRSTKGRK